MKDTEKKPSMVERARAAFKKKAQDTVFTDTNKRREKDAGLAKGGMVKKKTPNEKRLDEEKELDKLSMLGVDDRGSSKLHRAFNGDGYGTSRSKSALAAGWKESDRIYKSEDKRIVDVMGDKRPRQAAREAAAEERRESRGYAKGGMVKRGYGKARCK